ncbi:MAG: ABC transporter substrate-binding protein [Ramlibacter sp.]
MKRYLERWAWLLLAITLGAHGAMAAEAGVTDREIVVGQSLALTGPLAELAPDIVNGTQAYFDGVNANGGIHGRRVRMVTRDDGYVAANTVKVVGQMIDEDKVFALMNMTGTSNVAAVLPLLEKEKPPVPLIAPFTGAALIREPAINHVFNIRASYADETEKLVQHLTTIGVGRISVLWINNGFGKDGLDGVHKAMAKRGLKVYSSAPIEPDASDTDKAVAALHDTRPEVIIMITTGRATVDFIKAYNKVRKGMRFYTLSVMGTQATLRALGADGVGVVVTSVVPFPWSYGNPAAREYRAAMQKSGFHNISFLGFEAYLNARVFAEGLRRAGRELTRTRFIAALEDMKRVDLGGFEVGFGKNTRQGSRHVELVIIGAGQKFTR